MKKHVVLYAATSLDGFIARKDGSVDWLSGGEDCGYESFFKSIDALVIGRETYEQVLSFGPWPYDGKPCFVFTRRKLKSEGENIRFVSGDPREIVEKIHAERTGRIWLVGGGELIGAFRRYGLIDEYEIFIIPILLGDGIPLFRPPLPDEELILIESKPCAGGIIHLHYRRKPKD